MDLRDFGSTLARWWYLALATLLLAIGAAIGVYNATGPSYTANGTVLLLPPKAVMLQAQQNKNNYAPNNPLLYLGSLTDTRDVLVRHLSSSDTTDQLKAKAPGATVTIATDATSQSPLMLVKSTGKTEAEALQGVKALDDMVPGTLKSFQDEMDIAALQRVTSIGVTQDTKATANHKTQIELAVVSFVGVTVLGLALIALVDQLRGRRRTDDKELTSGNTAGTAATRSAGRPVTTGNRAAGKGATPVRQKRQDAQA